MTDIEYDEHGRPEPPTSAGELATLTGFLDFLRATFAWKCDGLSDEQLRVSVAASTMTLGGMLKHLAYVEDYWFTEVVSEAAMPEPWSSVDWKVDGDWDWNSAALDSGSTLHELWSSTVERSRATVEREAPKGLDAVHPAWGGRSHVSLRWVLVHMIEEYARHCGHADLIRESIDGQTGE